MNEILLLVSCAVIAAFSTVVGFGSGIILLGITMLLFPVKEAIPLVTIYYLFNNLNKILQLKTSIDYSVSWPVIRWSIPLVVLGSLLMPYAPERVIQKTLGYTILILLITRFFHVRTYVRKGSWVFKVGAGTYGFLSGFVGTGSAVKAILLSDIGLMKEEFVATMAFTAMFMNIVKLAVYGQYRLLSMNEFPFYSELFVASFIGVFLGKCLLYRLQQQWFLGLVYGALITTALELLLL